MNWQGAWSAGGTYVIDDAVGYGGASWFCIDPVGPSATNPASDPINWALLAAQGAQGLQGLTGLQGPTGATGPSGATNSLTTTGTGGAGGSGIVIISIPATQSKVATFTGTGLFTVPTGVTTVDYLVVMYQQTLFSSLFP